MAKDGVMPIQPCDQTIFQKGKPVVALDASSNEAETWVKAVAKEANACIDWHYSGGIAQVLHLGEDESRKRVETAITKLASELQGKILHQYQLDDKGLYRKGVTNAPDGASASFMNPETGEAAYI